MRKTGLLPVVDEGTRILILGSFPGEESLNRGEYYAQPRNQFWPIMSSLLGFNENILYNDKLRHLQAAHIGLWDVVESCERNGSTDKEIKHPCLNLFVAFFHKFSLIRTVYFNGVTYTTTKLPKRLWIQLKAILLETGIMWEHLPSTSPSFCSIDLKEKKRAWSKVLIGR